METYSEVAVSAGREHIANLATADGEYTFAREVLAGCWDHRRDVAGAIARVQDEIAKHNADADLVPAYGVGQ